MSRYFILGKPKVKNERMEEFGSSVTEFSKNVDGIEAESAYFGDRTSFQSLTEEEIAKGIVLFAHSETIRKSSFFGEETEKKTIDGLTPKELAKLFDKRFQASNFSKDLVKDIYLISCEAGFGDPSMAQEFAEALYELGYQNVVVHAEKQLEEPNVTGMMVGVVVPGGNGQRPNNERPVNNLFGGKQLGSLEVSHFSSKEQETQYFNLEEELQRLQVIEEPTRDERNRLREVKKELKALKQEILVKTYTNPIQGLNRPENSFMHPDSMGNVMSPEQQAAIDLIQARYDQKKLVPSKHDQKIARELEAILKALEKPNPEWVNVLEDLRQNLPQGDTRHMLKEITNNHGVISDQHRAPREPEEQVERPKSKPKSKRRQIREERQQRLNELEDKWREREGMEPRRGYQPQPVDMYTKSPDLDIVIQPIKDDLQEKKDAFITAINAYLEVLGEKKERRDSSPFGFFHKAFSDDMIGYKIQGLETLKEQIEGATSVDSIQTLIETALTQPKLVRSGIGGTHNVENLLTNLKNGKPEDGISEPTPVETAPQLS